MRRSERQRVLQPPFHTLANEDPDRKATQQSQANPHHVRPLLVPKISRDYSSEYRSHRTAHAADGSHSCCPDCYFSTQQRQDADSKNNAGCNNKERAVEEFVEHEDFVGTVREPPLPGGESKKHDTR